jgi:hypothetical protein
MSLSLLVAILFLLDFLKQTETIRFEGLLEFADAHRPEFLPWIPLRRPSLLRLRCVLGAYFPRLNF